MKKLFFITGASIMFALIGIMGSPYRVDAVALGQACTADNDCTATVQYSYCIPGTTRVCACQSGYTTQNGACVVSSDVDPTSGSLDVWGQGSGGQVTQGTLQTATGLGAQDPRTIAASVINVLLGFLGIIAVVLIIAGGFMWMTAAGNDDKIGTARKIMTAGVIGLVIVLAAFGIARFVINALTSATV
jgi:type IV secretory pathway VirB2 component (pilin)